MRRPTSNRVPSGPLTGVDPVTWPNRHFAVERGESLCKGSWPCAEMGVLSIHRGRATSRSSLRARSVTPRAHLQSGRLPGDRGGRPAVRRPPGQGPAVRSGTAAPPVAWCRAVSTPARSSRSVTSRRPAGSRWWSASPGWSVASGGAAADVHPGHRGLPARARCTSRPRAAVLDAVIDSGRAVAEVAGGSGWRGGRCRRR